jgi:predicted NAD/FAD-binding protein
MKKVAVIGSGISGTSSAYYLNKLGYDVSVFESGSYFGGHSNTVDISIDNKTIPVDTGFLVHNDRTYPNLIDFFKELKIKTHPSEMSFSVKRPEDNLLWAGTNLLTVFCQFKNLFSLRFYKFLMEVLKFNKHSKEYLELSKMNVELTLGDLLKREGYSDDFQKWYLLPMGGCIWSTPIKEMLNFPAYTFLVFCMNHGLLQIFNRPQWKTVVDGSRVYVEKALENIEKKYLNERIDEVEIGEETVVVKTSSKGESFDYVIMATHAPTTLELVKGLSSDTRSILQEFKYQPNKAVLHIDKEILPSKKLAWAAWNYTSSKSGDGKELVSVSYLINKLQPIDTLESVIVSLNPVEEINKDKVFKEIQYEHPVFNVEAIKAQKEISKKQGEQRVFFAGAWLRYGFHEDGILSAKKAVNSLLQTDESSKKIEVL